MSHAPRDRSLGGRTLMLERGTMRGTLIWFNPEKRMGYIRTEDGERLLVEESGFEPGHILGDRMAGKPLTFEREAGRCRGRVPRGRGGDARGRGAQPRTQAPPLATGDRV